MFINGFILKAMRGILLVMAAALPSAAMAQTVQIRNAWIRGTVGAQQATGAFMQITSGARARLVAVASPAAKATEMHNMKVEKDVMRMFPVDAIDLPAGETVKLAPGGYHIMLMSLYKPLAAGDRVPLKLTFEIAGGKREIVDLRVEVRDITGRSAQPHGH
jgi:periplasmic copper chaperone A